MNEREKAVGRREQRKADRRQAIIDAARSSFLEHGYADTSMSGLLKSLGGSKATLWSYFRTKEELFAAVVEQAGERLRGELEVVLSGHGELATTLTNFCRVFLDTIGTPEAIATWRMVMAEGGRFPELGRIFYETAVVRTHTALANYLLRQIEEGRLKPVDSGRMADTLIDLCAGQQTRSLWGLGGERYADMSEFTRIFLCAYAATSEG